MKKQYVIIGIVCSFLLIAGLCYSCNYKEDESYISLEKSNIEEDTEEETEIGNETESKSEPSIETPAPILYVHICGAVKKPGVYSINQGDRLIDLVELAGGFAQDAALDYMNQAQEVADGSRIYIPTKEELMELSREEYILGEELQTLEEEKKESRLVNINNADANELMSLPGIGEAKAKSIIEYRQSYGEFQKNEDIMKISGIKEGLFEKIKDKITVK